MIPILGIWELDANKGGLGEACLSAQCILPASDKQVIPAIPAIFLSSGRHRVRPWTMTNGRKRAKTVWPRHGGGRVYI